mmetsp:Transcript_32825/g.102418  ORF Transcript_32825/g.102418 Transcript_32825/m.102418 type:complete len:231 (+) Transcript_32825:1008-1700(+)
MSRLTCCSRNSRKVSTASSMANHRSRGRKSSTVRAAHRRRRRSVSRRSSTPLRRTLMATCRGCRPSPCESVPRKTCATLPPPSRAPTSRPGTARWASRTSALMWGRLTRSWSWAMPSQSSADSRSLRVESHCASLMKTGPLDSRAATMASGLETKTVGAQIADSAHVRARIRTHAGAAQANSTATTGSKRSRSHQRRLLSGRTPGAAGCPPLIARPAAAACRPGGSEGRG